MYIPSNIVVAAAGNIEHERVVELVARGLERRTAKAEPQPNVRPPLVTTPAPRLRFQQKDTEQYHVCLAAPGISRSDRRRFAVSLLDAILGGSASSRLFQEIREKRGMAYAVYSFVSQYTDTGQIGVYVGTREDNLAEALKITAEQIADIAGGNLPARELARAKENLKGRIVLSMESTAARMNRLGKSLITDSELLSLDRIVAEIDAVEASSVSELAGALRSGSDQTKFTVVGYGTVLGDNPSITPWPPDGLRRVAQSEFRSLHGQWLFLNQNPVQDLGGSGTGDSGGPVLWTHPLIGETTLVAITSRGNESFGNKYRVDTAEALDFLNDVLESI